MVEELGEKFSIGEKEIRAAVHDAWEELAACQAMICEKKEKKRYSS